MFGNDIAKFMNDTDAELTKRFRRVSLKALAMVVDATPVDTGCARANWNVKDGFPNEYYNSAITDNSGGKTIANGTSVISSATPDKTLYLTNSTPYIGVLEWGYSIQAPAGMVKPTVVTLKNLMERGLI